MNNAGSISLSLIYKYAGMKGPYGIWYDILSAVRWMERNVGLHTRGIDQIMDEDLYKQGAASGCSDESFDIRWYLS